MNFRTEIHIPPSPVQIGHHEKIFTLGSCFADAIGSRLAAAKFTVLSNPFGTIYNPISMSKLLKMSIKGEGMAAQHSIEREGAWFSLDASRGF